SDSSTADAEEERTAAPPKGIDDEGSRAIAMPEFMFATGIENSYPVITGAGGKARRVDEMAKCGHYDRWEEDFALVREMGLRYLRWGPAWYRVNPARGQYDWEWTDAAMAELQRLGITPVVDLCHFGVPDWLENFQNPELPIALAEYAAAVAQRFPHVRFYTPVNEIFIAAQFSARYGWWNERLSSEAAFVTALKNLCQANLRAVDAILAL